MTDRVLDVLSAIVGATRRIVEHRRTLMPPAALERQALAIPSKRGVFRAALADGAWPPVIAECKRRSPSRGVLRQAYDPAALARAYADAGAVAISVLTEPTFFDGSPAHLVDVRAAVPLPIVRKDFVVDEYQILEARAWGADAVLVIAAVLGDGDLRRLIASAHASGLEALVEVHDEEDLARALEAGAEIVGVNSRDLRSLAVDLSVPERLAARLPAHVVAVAESGLRTGSDLEALAAVGYRAFLVGERLIQADDPGAALEVLVHQARSVSR